MNKSEYCGDGRVVAVPVISVVLPVYNGAKYICEAIDSILCQTYVDFEIIVIDDGSTDGTFEVLRGYQIKDSRIRLISRNNKGLVSTLNEGIDIARGKWIARMDADDIALPHRFEMQLQRLNDTGADICGSWIKIFGTTGKRIIKHPQTDEAIKMAMLFGAPFAHPTVMMKRELARQLHYDKDWEGCEDYDLWARAARAGWKMTNVPEVLLLYRQHGAQISMAKADQQQALTQKIRRRHWGFVFDSMGLTKDGINEVLKLRETSSLNVNMDVVNEAFLELLERNQGEARATIFDHVTRIYFRAASTDSEVVARWSQLNKSFGSGFALATKAQLLLLSTFHIRSDSRLFDWLKKIYLKYIYSP